MVLSNFKKEDDFVRFYGLVRIYELYHCKIQKGILFFFSISTKVTNIVHFWGYFGPTYLKILTPNLKFKSRLDSNEQTASQGPFELAE